MLSRKYARMVHLVLVVQRAWSVSGPAGPLVDVVGLAVEL